MNITETIESIPYTQFTEISLSTSSTLVSGNNTPLQVPTKTIRSTSDTYSDPNTSEKFASQDNSLGAASHSFEIQKTAFLSFSHFARIERILALYNPFTYHISLLQNYSTLTYQSNRSND